MNIFCAVLISMLKVNPMSFRPGGSVNVIPLGRTVSWGMFPLQFWRWLEFPFEILLAKDLLSLAKEEWRSKQVRPLFPSRIIFFCWTGEVLSILCEKTIKKIKLNFGVFYWKAIKIVSFFPIRLHWSVWAKFWLCSWYWYSLNASWVPKSLDCSQLSLILWKHVINMRQG